MIKSSLLNNVHHSAMIRSVSHLRTVAVEPVLKFQDPAPAPGIERFWLRLQNNLVQNIRKKNFDYIYNSLAQQTISVDAEPKFQAAVPPSKSF